MTEPIRNWAGNIAFAAARLVEPQSVAELQAVVAGTPRLRALGSRHSFNRLADSDGTLVSLRRLSRVVGLDRAAGTVTVEGGITYGQLCPWLEAEGFALPNLASLPHIAVAGAIATGTHGSGNANRNLAAPVVNVELVTATGDIARIGRGDADFDGAVVGLGALGVVARLTLALEPRFEVRQSVHLGLRFETLLDSFEAITGSAYSVSLFTHWQGDAIDQLWLKRRAGDPPPPAGLFGTRPADRRLHPIMALDAASVTEQGDVPGPSHERLPHFRMAFQPSAGTELQSEYFVARANAPAALAALRGIAAEIAPHLLVSEIRTVAADAFWLSPAYGQDVVALHFTWKPDWPAVQAVLPRIEGRLAPLDVRPHWGKLFAMDRAAIAPRYLRLAAFRALAARLDPDGKFRNAFLDTCVL